MKVIFFFKQEEITLRRLFCILTQQTTDGSVAKSQHGKDVHGNVDRIPALVRRDVLHSQYDGSKQQHDQQGEDVEDENHRVSGKISSQVRR